jgi:eukaryotic-like serine/threonine-protein kinase
MRPGTIVARRFVVGDLAGRGAMGSVYRARDLEAGRDVALKVVHDSASVERFGREVAILEQLNHPAIVRYAHHGFCDDGRRYLAMEWLEGEPLSERLARSSLDVPDSLRLVSAAARALAAAHAGGVVHRDLKPSNLFLVGGSLSSVKVLDFGIAHVTSGARRLTRAGMMVGTPGYMAPEQATGEDPIDARADVYALGCVLFRCLTGRLPFIGLDPLDVLLKVILEEPPRVRMLRADVPEAVDALVSSMIAKSRRARLDSGAAVVSAIEAVRRAAADPPAAERRSPGRRPFDPHASPPAEGASHGPRQALTRGERRILCLVLLRPASLESAASRAPLSTIVDAAGGVLHGLPDGSLVGIFPRASAAHLAGKSERPPGSAPPASYPLDQAARAVRAALALRSELPGEALVVVTGRADLGAALPVGEVIERGARMLRSVERQSGAVLIDEATAGLAEARFEVRWNVAAGAGEVVGPREQIGNARTLLGKPTPCVGRDAELSALEVAVDRAFTERTAGGVLVTGAPGIGKSRLCHELLQRLRTSGRTFVTFTARGDPTSAGSPFELVAQMVRDGAAIRKDERLEGRRSKLLPVVSRLVAASERTRVTEFLAELSRARTEGDATTLEAAPNEAVLLGDQLLRAWIDFVEGACREAPLVLLVEDLQWGDVPSARFIEHALRVCGELPLFFVGFGRPEVRDLFPSLCSAARVHELRLGELTREASQQLALAVLGEATPTAVIERIVARSQGHAFFLEELIRSVANGAVGELPETVLGMVEGRLHALDPELRHVLRAASIFGQSFQQDGLLELLPESAASLSARLSRLVELEILMRDRVSVAVGAPEAFAFRHPHLREAAYAMLTESDRRLGHQLVASWLERGGSEAPLVLAEHWAKADAPERAAPWAHVAAKQALEGNDFEAVLTWVERGVAWARPDDDTRIGELLSLKAEALRWRAELAEAFAAADQALARLARGSSPWFAALEEAILTSANLRHAELRSLVHEVCDEQGSEASHAARGGALACAAASCAMYIDDEALLERVLTLVRDASGRGALPPTVFVRVHYASAVRALLRGDLGTYIVRSRDMLDACRASGNVRGVSHAAVNLGNAFLEVGALDRAEPVLLEGLGEARRMGLKYFEAVALSNLGAVHARRGELEAARAVLDEALRLSRSIGHAQAEAHTRTHLGLVLLLRGDFGEAEAEARRAVELVAACDDEVSAIAFLADVLLAQGRADEALAVSMPAIERLVDRGRALGGQAHLRLVHAEALLTRGSTEAARAFLESSARLVRRRADAIEDPELRRCFLERVPENAKTLALASRLATPEFA